MNKMDSTLTSMWVSFFTAAGIPSDVAATYALTFAENRIQSDMLLDLNKEYLRDMSITRMGDVIAILRHAKQVHESTARDKVLGNTIVNVVPVAAITGRATVTQNKPASPASRILEHYTRNPGDTSPTSPSTQKKRKSVDPGIVLVDISEFPTGEPLEQALTPKKQRRRTWSPDRAAVPLPPVTPPATQSVVEAPPSPVLKEAADPKKSRLIRFSSPQPPTVKEVTQTKQTVFARLGQTEAVKSATTVTTKEIKPIYARLGSKSDKIKAESQIPVQKDALKYEGILKSPPPTPKKVVTITTLKNNMRKIAMNCTMRADEEPMSIKEKLALPKSKSVKFSNRVEYKEIETVQDRLVKSVKTKIQPKQTVFNKPERRLSMPEGVNVKARLGVKDANNLTITKNVFNRLGM